MFQEYLAVPCCPLHQLMIAYHLHKLNAVRPSLSVTKTTELSLDVLADDRKDIMKCRFPAVTTVNIENNVCFLCTNYATGMLVCYGSTAGLPDFAEVLQIMNFVVRLQNTWYNEHFRSYELDNTGNVQLPVLSILFTIPCVHKLSSHCFLLYFH